MYFKIFKPISWGKRPAERRSRFIQRFLRIVLPAIFADKVFQKSEIFLMLLIDCNLCFRDTALSLQSDIQQRTVIHHLHVPQKLCIVAQLGQNAFKVFFVHAERDRVQPFVCFVSEQFGGGYLIAGEQ